MNEEMKHLTEEEISQAMAGYSTKERDQISFYDGILFAQKVISDYWKQRCLE